MPNPPSEPKVVLITGATGVLGSALPAAFAVFVAEMQNVSELVFQLDSRIALRG